MSVYSIPKPVEQPLASPISPDQLVASNIGDALVAAGLIDANKKEATVVKLAAGKMKGSDWKLLLELKKPIGGQ